MSNPEYIVYTDSELEQARSSYFEQKRLGTTQTELSKELFCRLIRNTMTNMISSARALQDPRYPSRHEVDAMARRLVEYYPMLKDKSSGNKWVCKLSGTICQYPMYVYLYTFCFVCHLRLQGHIAKKLMKRLSNVKSPKKARCSPLKKRRLTFDEFSVSDLNTDSPASSKASTIILEWSPVGSSTSETHQESSEDDAGTVYFLL